MAKKSIGFVKIVVAVLAVCVCLPAGVGAMGRPIDTTNTGAVADVTPPDETNLNGDEPKNEPKDEPTPDDKPGDDSDQAPAETPAPTKSIKITTPADFKAVVGESSGLDLQITGFNQPDELKIVIKSSEPEGKIYELPLVELGEKLDLAHYIKQFDLKPGEYKIFIQTNSADETVASNELAINLQPAQQASQNAPEALTPATEAPKLPAEPLGTLEPVTSSVTLSTEFSRPYTLARTANLASIISANVAQSESNPTINRAGEGEEKSIALTDVPKASAGPESTAEASQNTATNQPDWANLALWGLAAGGILALGFGAHRVLNINK